MLEVKATHDNVWYVKYVYHALLYTRHMHNGVVLMHCKCSSLNIIDIVTQYLQGLLETLPGDA